MTSEGPSLMKIYSGWDGYHTSLVRAVAPLSPEQLAYRIAADRRSVGELAAHIAFGRIDWFHRMGAPGTTELVQQAAPWWQPGGQLNNAVASDAAEIVRWLEAGWQMIEANLQHWTVADLDQTYEYVYWGKTYAISRQWTIWRIMAHDIHHGGQLTILLSAQGIEPPDLAAQGGHIIEPPLANDAGCTEPPSEEAARAV